MENLILRDFRLTRDFRSVAWGATLKYNLMRASAAGIIWAILIFWMSIADRDMTGGHPAWPVLAAPLMWPFMYLVIFLPFGLLFGVLSSFIPFIGLFSFFFALIGVSIGDPIICLVYAIAPNLVPVQRPSFMSIALIYYVFKPEESDQVVLSR